jgi:hypothetical protein
MGQTPWRLGFKYGGHLLPYTAALHRPLNYLMLLVEFFMTAAKQW